MKCSVTFKTSFTDIVNSGFPYLLLIFFHWTVPFCLYFRELFSTGYNKNTINFTGTQPRSVICDKDFLFIDCRLTRLDVPRMYYVLSCYLYSVVSLWSTRSIKIRVNCDPLKIKELLTIFITYLLINNGFNLYPVYFNFTTRYVPSIIIKLWSTIDSSWSTPLSPRKLCCDRSVRRLVLTRNVTWRDSIVFDIERLMDKGGKVKIFPDCSIRGSERTSLYTGPLTKDR